MIPEKLKAALDEHDMPGLEGLHRSYPPAGFPDRRVRARFDASPAPMAQLGEHEGMVGRHDDRVESTDTAARTAAVAPVPVHRRYRDADNLQAQRGALEEQPGVRVLDIAIREEDGAVVHPGQAHGHGRLAGAAFSGRDGDPCRPASPMRWRLGTCDPAPSPVHAAQLQCPDTSAESAAARVPVRNASSAAAMVGASVR